MASLPTLYKKSSSGKTMFWSVKLENADQYTDDLNIVVSYGQVDGKIQSTFTRISEGKNIGKSNETTIFEQAMSEAKSLFDYQINRKGYVRDLNDLNKDLRPGAEPMLAHRYDKSPEKIMFPCYIQPKLDGHRCIAILEKYDDNKVTCALFSRQRVPITGVPHINDFLLTNLSHYFLHPDVAVGSKIMLDGELYHHDYKSKFEELTGFIRSQEPKDGHEVVQYHIYDSLDASGTIPQVNRFEFINGLIQNLQSNESPLRLVNTEYVANDSQVNEIFKRYRADGYEGAILRNEKALYVGKRSYDLQKVKEFDDAEFIITDVEEGKGKMKGHAIFVCQTESGKQFKAKMKGSMESLAQIYQNKADFIGKNLTVMFQGRTSDDIPRFPVGLRVREDV